MNRECNVTKRVQTLAGLRYCPVVLSTNGRIKPDVVLVNGKPERQRHRIADFRANPVGHKPAGDSGGAEVSLLAIMTRSSPRDWALGAAIAREHKSRVVSNSYLTGLAKGCP